jgi:CBS-domain-containing membrane protein
MVPVIPGSAVHEVIRIDEEGHLVGIVSHMNAGTLNRDTQG